MNALRAVFVGVLLVVGALIGVVAHATYADWFTIPAAFEEGRKGGADGERAAWETKVREAEAKADLDRRAAQARIDTIERDYHQRDMARAAQQSALEAALEQEQADADPNPPLRGSVPVCRPAVPERLRDVLAPIGRGGTSSGLRPAVPSPAVR